jgi:hypothetical protein
LSNGYALSVARSTKNKNFTLNCDKGGTYRNNLNLEDNERVRHTGTMKSVCEFSIKGLCQDGLWSFWIRNKDHNHGKEDLWGRLMARRLSVEASQVIISNSIAGGTPKAALAMLRDSNPEILVTSRDVYNFQAKRKNAFLNNRLQIVALLDSMEQSNWITHVKYDDNLQITGLLMASPISVELGRKYRLVFLMDCTYKTNKFKMPLLNVVGLTPQNKSFFFCFIFLKEDTNPYYFWALQKISLLFDGVDRPKVIVTDCDLALMSAISSVFPNSANLLCLWHINKNVLANCRKHFENQESFDYFIDAWKELVN